MNLLHETAFADSSQTDVSACLTPPSLADALRQVTTWSDLSVVRIRDLRSDLRCVAAIIGQPPGDILLDCSTLSEALLVRPARAYGLSTLRHKNVMSSLRFALRRLGISEPKGAGPQEFGLEWGALWRQIAEGENGIKKGTKAKLSRFFTFCSRRGIAPTSVHNREMAAFLRTMCETELTHRPSTLAGRVTTAWNNLAASLPPGILNILDRVPARVPYVTPLESFPVTFQEDIAEFRACRSSGNVSGLFDDLLSRDKALPLRSTKLLRESTVKLRVDQLLLAAAAVVNTGRAPHSIKTLRDLVHPAETVKTILTYFWERGGQKKGAFIEGIAEALRQVAKFHCRLDPGEVRIIDAMKKRVQGDSRGGMCPRNRERLRAVIEPRNRALLLHLPDELMRQAKETRTPAIKARLLSCAIALEILFVCPLRISNLLGLRFDKHLRRGVGKDQPITHVIPEPREVKNNSAIEWPIPLNSAMKLDKWLKEYHALLGETVNGWLLPGKAGQHRSISSIQTVIAAEVDRMIGVRINPHLLRHFAAWLFLKHNPGQYEPVRRILGHRSIATTIAFHTGLEADSAAGRLDDVVLRERRVTHLIATGAFAKRARATGRGKGRL